MLSAAVALAIWQAVVGVGQMPRFILPGPLDVVQALIANAGLITENAAATIGEVLGGLVWQCGRHRDRHLPDDVAAGAAACHACHGV